MIDLLRKYVALIYGTQFFEIDEDADFDAFVDSHPFIQDMEIDVPDTFPEEWV